MIFVHLVNLFDLTVAITADGVPRGGKGLPWVLNLGRTTKRCQNLSNRGAESSIGGAKIHYI